MQLFSCSTPFGIIGILTLGASTLFSFPSVLNAFRHHRNSHAEALFSGRRRSLLVLNAFRHHRNSHGPTWGTTLPVTRAQRLSASSEFSPINIHRRHSIKQ